MTHPTDTRPPDHHHRMVQRVDVADGRPFCPGCGRDEDGTPIARQAPTGRLRCPECGSTAAEFHLTGCPYAAPLPRDPMQPARPIPAPQVPANPREHHRDSLVGSTARRLYDDEHGAGAYDHLAPRVQAIMRDHARPAVTHLLVELRERGLLQ